MITFSARARRSRGSGSAPTRSRQTCSRRSNRSGSAPTARSASCCCSSTTAVRGWPSANRRPEHAPVLGLVVATVERQLDPRWREHCPGEEPGHPYQAARAQAGDLPTAGAGGVEEVLLDPHVLAHPGRAVSGPAEMLAMEAPGSSQWMDPIEPEMEGGAVLLGRGPRCWQVQQLREDHEAPFRRTVVTLHRDRAGRRMPMGYASGTGARGCTSQEPSACAGFGARHVEIRDHIVGASRQADAGAAPRPGERAPPAEAELAPIADVELPQA